MIRTKDARVIISTVRKADSPPESEALATISLGPSFSLLPVHEREIIIDRQFARAADLAKKAATA